MSFHLEVLTHFQVMYEELMRRWWGKAAGPINLNINKSNGNRIIIIDPQIIQESHIYLISDGNVIHKELQKQLLKTKQ